MVMGESQIFLKKGSGTWFLPIRSRLVTYFYFFPVLDSNISIQVKYLFEATLGMVGKYLF